MARTKNLPRGWVNFTPRKFYVKTTNDVSQSNCKLADDNVTINSTRIINIGEEIQLCYDDNSSDNNDPLDLDKKSTGDKRKRSDDYDDNLRDDNDRSDLEKKSTRR
jgi:hypothetical protein